MPKPRSLTPVLLTCIVLVLLLLTLQAEGAVSRTVPSVRSTPVVHLAASPSWMPMTPGRTMTYETNAGASFVHRFAAPRQVTWFDDTIKTVVPLYDSRCDCQALLMTVGDQVRAVGEIHGEQLRRWGEYLVIFPGAAAGIPEPVSTPAGHFPGALRIDSPLGPAWFAPGVGLVKTIDFVLTHVSAGAVAAR